MSHSERDGYLSAHPELPPETVFRVRALLSADDRHTTLPHLAMTAFPGEQTPNTEIHPGDMLGRYRIVRHLGSGGMGTVFEALREEGEIRLRVAIKVLQPELAFSEFLLQLRQEAARLAKLRHPNIARLLDWELDRCDPAYCVLEYIDGESITSWCQRQKMDRQARLSIFLDACNAVAFAHRNMIVHLDLKPANILVNASGEVRLVDFGIARTLAQEPASTVHDTQLRAFSAHYASPEQIRGESLSASSDIYSLGVVLRELLLLPDSKEKNATAGKQLAHELEAIISRATAYDAESRYATVQELHQDLRNYISGYPVHAVRQTPIYLLRRFCARNLGILVTWSAIGATFIASLGLWQVHVSEERQYRRAEQLRKSVLQLSSTLLFPLEDEMRNLPGSTPVRTAAVHTGIEYLQSLSAEARNDPALALELGKAYTKLGDIQGNPANPNLGDETGAKASYETARRLLSNQHSPEAGYAYGQLLTHEADLIDVEGDLQTADRLYREAVGVFAGLVRAGATDVHVKESLESAMVYLADLQSSEGRDDLARVNYEQGLDLARKLVQEQPRDINYQRSLARCGSRLGNLEWNAGRWQQAFNAYRDSLNIYDTLLRQQSDNIKVRHSWIAGAYNVAATDEHLNQTEEALDLYLRAEQVATRDAEIDPHDAQALRDQQVGYSNLTRVYLSLGRLSDAENTSRRELAIAQSLWKRNPQDAMARDDLAGSEEHVAQVQQKRRQFAAAVSSEQDALRLLDANLRLNQSAASMGAVVDALLRLADYDLDIWKSTPAASDGSRLEAMKCFTQLQQMAPRLRSENAEDRERIAKTRALEARLRSEPGS